MIEQHHPGMLLSVLKIGAFQTLLAETLLTRPAGRMARYPGVDPQIGDDTDQNSKAY